MIIAMSSGSRRCLATAYERLLAGVYSGVAAESQAAESTAPSEMQIQACWAAGLLGNEGLTHRHGTVRILDPGMWNRSAGPDFLRAEIEIDGVRRRGDIEIDPAPQDWERHGHGANPAYNQVVLHVVLTPPGEGWYTRNAAHIEVPVLYLAPEVWRRALGMPSPPCRSEVPRCRAPLAGFSPAALDSLFRCAAAHRTERKRAHFRRKIEALGEHQAWFEAWAETLGYSANKNAMQMLVRRAPLKELGARAEAILLGTAGFLLPVLPTRCSEEARAYHRSVWDVWWELREQYELSHEHRIPWVMAPVRPLNHPHRRVAALALSARRWRSIAPLLNAASATRLRELLTSLSHPFWDSHCTMSSAALRQPMSLIGDRRVDDFLVNFVYTCDDSDFAWQTYLSLPAGKAPSAVLRTADALFGNRPELNKILSRHYVQQALLQIEADFCAVNICRECLFPTQLAEWCSD